MAEYYGSLSVNGSRGNGSSSSSGFSRPVADVYDADTIATIDKSLARGDLVKLSLDLELPVSAESDTSSSNVS